MGHTWYSRSFHEHNNVQKCHVCLHPSEILVTALMKSTCLQCNELLSFLLIQTTVWPKEMHPDQGHPRTSLFIHGHTCTRAHTHRYTQAHVHTQLQDGGWEEGHETDLSGRPILLSTIQLGELNAPSFGSLRSQRKKCMCHRVTA
ncbi:hypothetical protein HJG60_010771 [Phyllostomus discolor]|uniref:Uncharacterized protein n=1 Tax=Phyllostomus discolor TaxID=89673 RepID=A0A834AEG3_9CHIR|nr:hypothetical protein HJG60_010771 [Phyllostomus discolor]